MARQPRLAIAGLPHHVIARGRGGAIVFVDDDDRCVYLRSLYELARDCAVAVHAYALLDREVRLLATPGQAADLSRLMQRLARRHVALINRRHARSGPLWEARYKGTVIEPERYLLSCMNGIEHEPVRQALVARAEAYRWSSAAHHHGVSVDAAIVEHALYWALGNTPFEREAAYRALHDRAQHLRDIDAIALATQKGWALGSASFLAGHSAGSARRLSPAVRGRRPKRSFEHGPI